jgi:hypothetical protein
MKRQVESTFHSMCNKKVKESDSLNDKCDDKPTTSDTLTEAEKKARHAEYQRNYRRRVKEQKQQMQLGCVTLDDTGNRPTTSQTLTEAERKARHVQYQRNYRKRIKERKQQQLQESVTLNETGNRPTTSQTLTEAERKVRHAENQRNRRRRIKEERQQQLQQQEKEDAKLTEHDERDDIGMDQESDVEGDDATMAFKQKFDENPLGHVYDVCDRIWFKRDLRDVPQKAIETLTKVFLDCDVSCFYVYLLFPAP